MSSASRSILSSVLISSSSSSIRLLDADLDGFFLRLRDLFGAGFLFEFFDLLVGVLEEGAFGVVASSSSNSKALSVLLLEGLFRRLPLLFLDFVRFFFLVDGGGAVEGLEVVVAVLTASGASDGIFSTHRPAQLCGAD